MSPTRQHKSSKYGTVSIAADVKCVATEDILVLLVPKTKPIASFLFLVEFLVVVAMHISKSKPSLWVG